MIKRQEIVEALRGVVRLWEDAAKQRSPDDYAGMQMESCAYEIEQLVDRWAELPNQQCVFALKSKKRGFEFGCYALTPKKFLENIDRAYWAYLGCQPKGAEQITKPDWLKERWLPVLVTLEPVDINSLNENEESQNDK